MSSFNKVDLLERCNQMFICSICCDAKANGQCKQFSTSSVSLFLEHQRCYHYSVTDFECIYCCCNVPNTNLIQHIQNHFLDNDMVNTKCSLCQEPMGQNWRSILAHMQSQHNSDVSICPLCHGDFHSFDGLQAHLLASQLILYHCPSPQCLVKSHGKSAILAHLINKHGGSRCLRVQCQYTCSERISQNTNCSCTSTTNQIPESPTKTVTLVTDETQLIDLPYSSRVLAKLAIGLDERLQDDLCLKMEQYSKFKVRLELVDGQKQFVCSTCQYRSVHSLADVRKHILGCHCSVSTSYTRLCLRASRLDTNNFTLFSDRKLISFANEKLKRAENGSTWDGNCDYSGLQLLDDSEQESGSNSESFVRSNKRPSFFSSQEANIKKAKLKQRQSHGAKMRPDSPVPEVGPPLERNENFDRVINLNYSWPVLEKLVLGQCPERYLPILKQKMDVYSQHRILLTRRNGKRYFLCSHCPNCSPHGMNDIRKHILGVHARLPERFKSAAMYCSRMNRDNYGLLSDDELLKKNQDMVRWRSNPSQAQEDFGMEPLAPLNHSLLSSSSSLEDHCPGSSIDLPSHNIFLSGDTADNGSPNSLTIVTDPINAQLTSSFQHYSQMHLQSLFAGINSTAVITTPNTSVATIKANNGNGHLSDESSPKFDDDSNTAINANSKGCSRRSLVLKSRTTSHNNQNIANNI